MNKLLRESLTAAPEIQSSRNHMARLFQAARLSVSMVEMWPQFAEGKKFVIYQQ